MSCLSVAVSRSRPALRLEEEACVDLLESPVTAKGTFSDPGRPELPARLGGRQSPRSSNASRHRATSHTPLPHPAVNPAMNLESSLNSADLRHPQTPVREPGHIRNRTASAPMEPARSFRAQERPSRGASRTLREVTRGTANTGFDLIRSVRSRSRAQRGIAE